MPTEFTEENVEAFLNRSSQFVQDDHNLEILKTYLKHQQNKNREISIEGLAEFINRNANHFHWLRSEAEIAAAVEAAKPKPEPPQPTKLKGLTIAERLAQVGVQASPHLSHADRQANDQQKAGVIHEMAKAAEKTQRDIERQTAIAEARSIVVYTPGPNGRVDHGKTESARNAALARLGITE